jgi:hypothetical protein
LETIGVLLPFLTNPKFFVNKHVLCSVDNLSVVFNWEKRAPKGDKDFENLFKILHLLEITIPCKIYIQQVYRRSCKFSKLADDLTREKTSKNLQINKSPLPKILQLTGSLKNGLKTPALQTTFL